MVADRQICKAMIMLPFFCTITITVNPGTCTLGCQFIRYTLTNSNAASYKSPATDLHSLCALCLFCLIVLYGGVSATFTDTNGVWGGRNNRGTCLYNTIPFKLQPPKKIIQFSQRLSKTVQQRLKIKNPHEDLLHNRCIRLHYF